MRVRRPVLAMAAVAVLAGCASGPAVPDPATTGGHPPPPHPPA
jgi:type IV pilus biogenesis protein CpaD/CtpE